MPPLLQPDRQTKLTSTTLSHPTNNHTTMLFPLFFLAATSLAFALPTHFPPAAFTNYTTILPEQLPILVSEDTSITWNPAISPSILLCSEKSFDGNCWLLLDNAPKTCLNLDMGTMEVGVGSARVGGGAGCMVFE